MTNIGQGTLDTIVTPAGILLCKLEHELANFLSDGHPARALASIAVIMLGRHELAMPTHVEGGSKRRRGVVVGAVEIGGAHACSSARCEDTGVSPYLAQLRREAQECDPTWSFGKRFVGRC